MHSDNNDGIKAFFQQIVAAYEEQKHQDAISLDIKGQKNMFQYFWARFRPFPVLHYTRGGMGINDIKATLTGSSYAWADYIAKYSHEFRCSKYASIFEEKPVNPVLRIPDKGTATPRLTGIDVRVIKEKSVIPVSTRRLIEQVLEKLSGNLNHNHVAEAKILLKKALE